MKSSLTSSDHSCLSLPLNSKSIHSLFRVFVLNPSGWHVVLAQNLKSDNQVPDTGSITYSLWPMGREQICEINRSWGNVHSSTIYNSQDMEATKVSIDR